MALTAGFVSKLALDLGHDMRAEVAMPQATATVAGFTPARLRQPGAGFRRWLLLRGVKRLHLPRPVPAVVGYIIGDHSVKSKSKLSHHFNGMLFGLFAYWCMVLTTVFITVPTQLFPDTNARLALVNVLPGIFVAIVASVIAGMHVRSKQATLDVLEYRPFVLVFVASIIAMPLLGVINNIVTNSVTVFTFFTPFITLLFGLISYVTLNTSKLSSLQKSAWSAVSLSVLFVAERITKL